MKNCPNCGSSAGPRAKFCGDCGTALEDYAVTNSNDSGTGVLNSSPASSYTAKKSATDKTPQSDKNKSSLGRILLYGLLVLAAMLATGAAPTPAFIVAVILLIVAGGYLFVSQVRGKFNTAFGWTETKRARNRVLFVFILSIFISLSGLGGILQDMEGDKEEVEGNQVLLAQADAAVSSGNFDEALKILSRVTIHPKTLETKDAKQVQAKQGLSLRNYRLGVEYMEKGEWQNAIALLQKVLENDPNSDDARAKIETAFVREIEEKYQKALALKSRGDWDASMGLFEELGNYKDSRQQTEAITAKKRDLAYDKARDIYNKRDYKSAKIKFLELGKYKDAAMWAEKAMQRANETVYRQTVRLYRARKYKDARTTFVSLGTFKDSAKYVERIDKKLAEIEKKEKRNRLDQRASGIGYKQLKKNPDRHIGTFVKFRGKVFNIQESKNQTQMQINVTHKGYGIWDDQVMVIFKGLTEIVEGNMVTFYGAVLGAHTYTSMAGWNITVPLVEAEQLYW